MQCLMGARNAHLLHRICGFAQPRSVDDVQRHSVNLDCLADHIAGSAGNIADQRHLLAGQTVQQAGLADVRLPGNGHMRALAQQAALLCSVQRMLQMRPHAG